MADEPTNGELGRLIQSLRDDMREDMGHLRSEMREDLVSLNGRLDKVVPMDVYSIEKTQLTDRVTALETQREKDADKVIATRRWVIGIGVMVAVALLPYLSALVKGATA